MELKNCCAGWGYTVAFTKVLIMYQIYHTWIHPLHHSFNPLPLFLEQFQQVIIFAFAYMCIYYLCRSLYGTFSNASINTCLSPNVSCKLLEDTKMLSYLVYYLRYVVWFTKYTLVELTNIKISKGTLSWDPPPTLGV
jgi:hypothetical protein